MLVVVLRSTTAALQRAFVPLKLCRGHQKTVGYRQSAIRFLSVSDDNLALNGSIIVRIVPSHSINYEEQKPEHTTGRRDLLDQLSGNVADKKDTEIGLQQQQQQQQQHLVEDTNDNRVFLNVVVNKGLEELSRLYLKRDAEEPVQRTLARLQLSIHKKLTETENTAEEPPNYGSPKLFIESDEELTSSETRSIAVWRKLDGKEGASIQLLDEQIRLSIISCPPTILSVKTFEHFEGCVFVGTPLFIQSSVLHGSRVSVNWFVDGKVVKEDSASYVPTRSDVGKTISVLLVPIGRDIPTEGHEEVYQFRRLVEELPELPIVYDIRKAWTRPRTESESNLRIMTYNLLADMLTQRDGKISRRFKYCPAEAIDRKRRMPLLLHELLAYNADIICLQEVDASMYESLFQPVLAANGYQGFLSTKSSEHDEGCALFWSLNTFGRVKACDLHSYPIKDLFIPTNRVSAEWNRCMTQARDVINDRPYLRSLIQEELRQLVQAVTLQKSDGTKLVVANTHLYFQPRADHIRLLQVLVICHQLECIARSDGSEDLHPIVLAGDLNSDPGSGAIQLLLGLEVQPSHEVWKYLNYSRDGLPTGQSHGPPPAIKLPSSFPILASACKGNFTHFIPGFVERLDYIMLSEAKAGKSLKVKSSAPMPKFLDILPLVGMPNRKMPSDHISVVCDVEIT